MCGILPLFFFFWTEKFEWTAIFFFRVLPSYCVRRCFCFILLLPPSLKNRYYNPLDLKIFSFASLISLNFCSAAFLTSSPSVATRSG